MEALAAAWSLAGVASWYHNILPLCGAAPIAVFALFGPMRLGSLILSRAFQRFVVRFLQFAILLAATAFALSFAVNSGLPILADIGSALFLAFLGIIAFLTFRTAKNAASLVIPAVFRTSDGAFGRLRLVLGWLSLSLPNLPTRQSGSTQSEMPPRR
jgi:hypothetical protein